VQSIAGETAIVGIGESAFYKRGQSPDAEFKLALTSILNAVEDAGLNVTDIDGFTSFYYDRSGAHRLAHALGLPDLKVAGMGWEGGHAGAAISMAATAVHAGLANYVVAFRSIAQGQFGRFGQFGGYQGAAGATSTVSYPTSFSVPYGAMSPGQLRAGLRATRYMHEHGVSPETLRAISLACYHHAQLNPRALMNGRELSAEGYDNSRWVVEPLHLFDFCMENDCAAAVIVTTRERAADLKQKPAYIRSIAHGSDYRQGNPVLDNVNLATANLTAVGARLFQMAGVEPADIDNAQIYDNFTNGVLMTIAELGFCRPEELNDFVRLENLIAPHGKLPLNTSGGNLADAYVHGMELVTESVRQIRGTSTAQVPGSELSLFTSATLGPVTGAGILSGS
jgi:acetyl-CoA acetyltransferase